MILAKYLNNATLSGTNLRKYRSKKTILNTFYECGPQSAALVGEKLGVSLPTAISLINDLVNDKFVEVKGEGESRGGRKPVLFGLSKSSLFIVACEIGRYSAKVGVYNALNENVSSIIQFETSIDDDQLEQKIYENSCQLLKDANIQMSQVQGVGIAMPGLINDIEGIDYTIKNSERRNVKHRLEKKFQKLIYISNDARMQAYGEYKFGLAKNHKNAIIVNWNWGIGLGMIFNGNLYSGATGFAGELSHIKVVDNGDLCICGKRGCLETVTSVKVILTKARNGIKKGVISQLTRQFKSNPEYLKVDDIITAARQGDEFSISLLTEVGLALGKGLSITIQLLNPDIIVLGGVMAKANQFVLTPIQQSLNKYCLEQISVNTQIMVSEDWEQSGLLGVTAMLFQKLFSNAT